MPEALNLMVVAGAIRSRSRSKRVAHLLAARLRDAGHSVDTFDLGLLPLYGSLDAEAAPPVVAEWRGSLLTHDATAWVTPTYHNQLPGTLKNALDYFGFDTVRGTLHGVVGASTITGQPAAVALGNVLRLLGGHLPASDLFVAGIDKLWPLEVELPPTELVERLDAWAAGFAVAVARFRGG